MLKLVHLQAYECLCTVSVEDSISITGELHVPKVCRRPHFMETSSKFILLCNESKADSKASGKRSIATSKKTATKINLSLSSGVRRRKGIRTASSSWKVYRKKMQVGLGSDHLLVTDIIVKVSNILRTSKR